MLFKHSMQPVSSSCSGVSPLSDACVATGMNMGSSTGPWGRIRVEALALLVEQRALMSKVKADDLDVEAILQLSNACG